MNNKNNEPLRELGLHLGVSIKLSDAEARKILAGSIIEAEAALTKIISEGRGHVNGNIYIPATCIEYFNSEYFTMYGIGDRNFEIDISSALHEDKDMNMQELLDYCKKMADNLENMQKQVMSNVGKGESEQTALGAYAYFAQQETIYRYNIPRILEAFNNKSKPKNDITELRGQLVDIVEDYLTENCVPDKDAVFIKGDDYDKLADKFTETLKNWGLI